MQKITNSEQYAPNIHAWNQWNLEDVEMVQGGAESAAENYATEEISRGVRNQYATIETFACGAVAAHVAYDFYGERRKTIVFIPENHPFYGWVKVHDEAHELSGGDIRWDLVPEEGLEAYVEEQKQLIAKEEQLRHPRLSESHAKDCERRCN